MVNFISLGESLGFQYERFGKKYFKIKNKQRNYILEQEEYYCWLGFKLKNNILDWKKLIKNKTSKDFIKKKMKKVFAFMLREGLIIEWNEEKLTDTELTKNIKIEKKNNKALYERGTWFIFNNKNDKIEVDDEMLKVHSNIRFEIKLNDLLYELIHINKIEKEKIVNIISFFIKKNIIILYI